MRIVSGYHGGRRIIAPNNLPVRPTTDKAKEALFNVLNNIIDFQDITVLDLFAGIGSISYEFSSRGAKQITAVDSHYGCVKFINETATKLHIDNINVIKGKTERFLKYNNTAFDLVFADPPYALPWLEELPNLILSNPAFATNTFVIIEHPEQFDFSNNKSFYRHLKYGKVNFTIFHKNG